MLFFPDNTVLINFAIIGRLDLLETLLNRQGRWCSAVASECARSANVDGLSALRHVGTFLLDPVQPTPAELVNTQILRTGMLSPGDDRRAHLGEAETVAIISERSEFRGALFVTDDNGARQLAASNGISTAHTWSLLKLATRVQRISLEEHVRYVKVLERQGRRMPRGEASSD